MEKTSHFYVNFAHWSQEATLYITNIHNKLEGHTELKHLNILDKYLQVNEDLNKTKANKTMKS